MAAFEVSPDTLLTTTMVRFDCSLSQPGNDQDQAYYRWDWNGDGFWNTGFSSTAIVKHTYYETGDFQPTLEVIDTTGKVNLYRQKLFVNQISPNLHLEFEWT